MIHRCQGVEILLIVVELHLQLFLSLRKLRFEYPAPLLRLLELLLQLINEGLLDLHVLLNDLLLTVELGTLLFEDRLELLVHFYLFLLETRTLDLKGLRLFFCFRGEKVYL